MVADVGGAGGDPIGVVFELAGGAKLVSGEGVVDAFGEASGEGSGPVVGGKRSAFVEERAVRDLRFDVAVLGEHLNHGAGGFGAIEGAFRSAHDFNAIKAGGGEMGEVEIAAGVSDGDAVEQDHGGIAIASAGVEIGESAVAAGLDDGHAGNVAKKILDEGKLACGEIGGGEDVGGDAGFFHRDGGSGGGDEHAVAQGRKRQRNLDFLRVGQRDCFGSEAGFFNGCDARFLKFEVPA
jgi:hypothetical protein